MPLGRAPAQANGFESLPKPVMVISTTSPDLRNVGGFMPMPTPAGVPV
jgi:hypothetical protein